MSRWMLALGGVLATVASVAAQQNGPIAPGPISGLSISPDGERAIYLSDRDQHLVYELFSVPLRGAHPVTQLNPPLLPNRYVGGQVVKISPDSTRVVYAEVKANELGHMEIYSVPIAGGTAVKLNGALGTNGTVENFAIAPNSGRVVFLAAQPEPLRLLYSRRLDGVGPVAQLSPPQIMRAFPVITPDSTRVVYTAGNSVNELYSVPVDGSAPPVKLSDPMGTGGNVTEFNTMLFVSPDSKFVVYRADRDADEAYEVYAVPVDGSGPPVELNAPLVAGGDVIPVEISPDSSRVLYTGDQDVDDVFNIYSVPIGGGPSVKLNPGSVGGYAGVSPDSTPVVLGSAGYLYSVSIDGSAAPVPLSGPLTPGGIFYRALIDPTGRRVVYAADQEIDDKFELYSVPIDGSAPAIKLNQPLVPAGDVLTNFVLDPTGRRVLYTADPLDLERALFSVPIDRSFAASPVSEGRSRVAGSVDSYQITPDGERVLYLDDVLVPGVYDLYAARLTLGLGQRR